MRPEQRQRLTRGGERVFLCDDTLHAALVVLVRSVHVEELQSHPLRRPRTALGELTRHPAIEQGFAPSVRVERAQFRERLGRAIIVEAMLARTIGGRGGSVDKALA